MKVVIAGGAGFIGRSLVPHFTRAGYEVVILSRREGKPITGARIVAWDGESPGPWMAEINGAGLLLNLAGRSVNCRYTKRNRHIIYESRLRSTRVLGRAVSACAEPPPIWINAASATIYRHAEDRDMDDETGEIGTGFSVDVCRKWEKTFADAPAPATRKVALRMAMVMGPERGGVYTAFRVLARLGLAGTLGTGRQYMSWIHHVDLYGVIEWIRTHPEIVGACNVSAPHPLPNREFMRMMREVSGAFLGLPAMAWMLEIGAFFLRTETELLLKSRWVVPSKLLAGGYRFRFPTFAEAAREIASRGLFVSDRKGAVDGIGATLSG